MALCVQPAMSEIQVIDHPRRVKEVVHQKAAEPTSTSDPCWAPQPHASCSRSLRPDKKRVGGCSSFFECTFRQYNKRAFSFSFETSHIPKIRTRPVITRPQWEDVPSRGIL